MLLLRAVRAALDFLGAQTGRRYGLTAALPCAADHVAQLETVMEEVTDVLDGLNLLTYDFHGAWDAAVGANAPLFAAGPPAGGSVHGCVERWAGPGAGEERRRKLHVGLAFYGRSYAGAAELGTAHGGSDAGSWPEDDGVPQFYRIRAALEGGGEMTSMRDEATKTQYAYFNDGRGMVSYDDERAICDKVGYVTGNGLGGFIICEFVMRVTIIVTVSQLLQY